jgi:hypothetical protein
MPTEHKNGILRDVGVSDNYMPTEYSDTNAYNIVPYPRIYVKLPARIVDEHAGSDASATFEIDTNVFDETDIKASIDDFDTEVTLSSGIVSFTSLVAGDYTLKVRGYRSPTTYVQVDVPFTIYYIGEYNTKYTLTFKDNYNDETFTVRIKERDYDGSVIEFKAGDNPVIIDWGFDSPDEVYGAVLMPSRCQISLVVENDGDYDDLYDDSDQYRFKVEILRGAGLSAALYWQGWLSGNTYQVPLKDAPYIINVIAYCGIANLANVYATTGNRFTGRLAWNHDSISLTELIWAIRRELRLSTTSSSTPGVSGPNKILYYDHLIPIGHDADYPGLHHEVVDLRNLVEQDMTKTPTVLIALLEGILQPQFCKLIPYAGRWYIVPTIYYNTDSLSGHLQSTRTIYTSATLNDLLPSVDGINHSPLPDYSWRDNNQTKTFTETFNTIALLHKNKFEGSIPILPWFGENISGSLINKKVLNNQPGWFYFYEAEPADNPAPIRWNLQFLRVRMDYAVGCITQINTTVPGYWGIEPVPFYRHSNPDIHSLFEIKFTSHNFDSANLATLRIQVLCGGYYLTIPLTDSGVPEWVAMDLSIDTFSTYTQVIETQEVDFGANSFSKNHTIITPILPEALLDQEHFAFRVIASNNADYDDVQVVFVDNLKISQKWATLDEDLNPNIMSDDILEELLLLGNPNLDETISFELPIWNGFNIDGCTTSIGNDAIMADDEPIQAMQLNTATVNKVKYWAEQIRLAYASKRKIISGSISEHIQPWRHPVYRGDQYIISNQTHDLKANKSSVKLVQLPEQYVPLEDVLMVFDTTLEGNPDFAGGALEVAFRLVLGISGGTVYWGDDTSTSYSSGDQTATHTYATAGEYSVTIQSQKTFAVVINGNSTNTDISGKVSAISQIGSKCEYFNGAGTSNVIQSINSIQEPEPSTNINSIGYARYAFENNSIPTSNVNSILESLTSWTVTGNLNLSGQTPSAPPSGAGATAVTTLEGLGWTITVD